MAVFRLTAGNLAFVKSELRILYPTIKSSHLTEALAAALGSQTHAALRVLMARSAPGAEPLTRIDTTLWRERLTDLGYGGADFDGLMRVMGSAALPDPCWRAFAKGDLDGINAWFYYCRSQNLPYVFITKARKYVDLNWDCISVEPSHEGRVRGPEAQPIIEWLFGAFQARAKHDTGRPMFEGNTFVGSIEKLLPDTAADLADAYFARLYDLTREPTRKVA